MAFAARYATQLASSERNIGVDSFLMGRVMQINPAAKFYRYDGMLPNSLDTDGYNNITKGRKKQYNRITKRCFFPTDKTLYDVLPKDIAQRIEQQHENFSVSR